MLYITFDSDVWLNSLKESGDVNNFIDSLEYWIENGNIKILLPENIIEEWKRNRDKKKQLLVNDWKYFFNRARKVFSPEVVSLLMTPDKLNERVEEQLKRVETIFENYAIKIPITNDYKLKAAELAEQKKAPFGQKNSIGDAYIFLSITDYISANNLSGCVFVTNNHTDFSQKDDLSKIHPDLEPQFTKLKIAYYIDLRRFMYEYASQLPDVSEIKKMKTLKEEDRKLTNAVLNPQTLENLTGLRDSYIENVNHLDLILKTKKPTKEQVIFALGLVDSDESYKQYFFKKVESSVWFNILKDKGVFEPEHNPLPVPVQEGFQIPYWEVLSYLEKLSIRIKEVKELELVEDILGIIKNVSEHPRDNFRTWYMFIKILSNFPNDRIPVEIFNYIPVWFPGRYNTMIQTSEVCERLLPKFLNEQPSKEDILKAEIILHYLFEVEKTELTNYDLWDEAPGSYHSRVYLHFLANKLSKHELLPRVVRYCSTSFIFELGRTIKFLLLDYPSGLKSVLKDGDKEYEVKILIDKENLLISSKNKEGEAINDTYTITNFEYKSDDDLKNELITIFETQNINYTPSDSHDDTFKRLNFALYNDLVFSFGLNSIRKIDDNNEKELNVFSVIFRDLLDEKAKQNPEEAISIMKTFCYDKKYYIPFYKRIALYVICENWDTTKSLFWEFIKDNDPLNLFSHYIYQKELYELLDNNQQNLSEYEKKILQEIIDKGKHTETTDLYEERHEYWQLRWYSALRNIEPFNQKYSHLSKQLGITNEHYENIGELKVRVGSVSPFSAAELVQKSTEDIVKFIHSFRPKNRWEEPTIDGLSDSLSAAIQIEPQKFSEEIILFKDVPFIYAYHIANGFREAWKSNKTFNWENVLNFFITYISDEKYKSGQLSLENDGWGATSDWVTGSIGNLLTEGMQSDSHAFDLSLLHFVKDILTILVPRLNQVDDFTQTNMDYPTYSFNSTAGKVLRSLLDYSLRRARNLKTEENLPIWEEDMKDLFEDTLRKGIVDGYIITGLYFQQFYFLDKDWIIEKVRGFYKLDNKEWIAFLSGFAFSNPPLSKEIYHLFYPHYERAIENDIQVKSIYGHGIIRHIVSFYFWGFEDLQTNGLLLMLINKGKHSEILELINFVWRQKAYLKTLNNEESKNFEVIIFNLWKFVANKYENAKEKDEQKVLTGLTNLLVFVPELNDQYTELILKSSGIAEHNFLFDHLIENLIRLKDQGNPNEVAKNIGVIMNSIQFTPYLSPIDNKQIIELVISLYENGQKEIADEFCNKMAKTGEEFLIEIHNKYKE